MSETVSALAGVAVGVILTEVAAFCRRRGEEGLRSKRVKTLIQVEVDHNLCLLRQLAECIKSEERVSAGQPSNVHLPSFLAGIHLPVWSRSLWTSQLPDVASALRQDALRATCDFYGELDNITEMVQAIRDNPNQVGYRKELYDRCIGLVGSILDRGNPAA